MNTLIGKIQENKVQTTVNANLQKQGNAESILRRLDNRYEAGTQRALQEIANNSTHSLQLRVYREMAGKSTQAKHTGRLKAMTNSGTVQRLVAVAGTDSDALVSNNIDYARGQFDDPVVNLDKGTDFSVLGSDMRVGIVGHGAPGHIDNKSGADIADILTQGSHPIPIETKSVYLYSCNAALEGPKNAPSLVAALSTALHNRGYKTLVSGMYGICFAFQGINERTTKGLEKEGDDAWFPLRNTLLSGKYKHLSSGNGFISTEDMLKNDGIKDIDKLSPAEKAREISRIMKPFWRDVEAAMEAKGTLADHLSGWLSVLTLDKGHLEVISDSYQK